MNQGPSSSSEFSIANKREIFLLSNSDNFPSACSEAHRCNGGPQFQKSLRLLTCTEISELELNFRIEGAENLAVTTTSS